MEERRETDQAAGASWRAAEEEETKRLAAERREAARARVAEERRQDEERRRQRLQLRKKGMSWRAEVQEAQKVREQELEQTDLSSEARLALEQKHAKIEEAAKKRSGKVQQHKAIDEDDMRTEATYVEDKKRLLELARKKRQDVARTAQCGLDNLRFEDESDAGSDEVEDFMISLFQPGQHVRVTPL